MRRPSPLQKLCVVTISGAHGVGKTTLLADLKAALEARQNIKVALAESCSSRLFERIQAGQVSLPKDTPIPKTYDDINRYNLRAFFQTRLPNSLSFEVDVALDGLHQKPPVGATRKTKTCAYLLVDRWFPDIYAYTVIESHDSVLKANVAECCRVNSASLESSFERIAIAHSVVNLFVPLSSSPFEATNEKFRATCNRAAWEKACISGWNHSISPRRRRVPVLETSREGRVEEVLKRILIDSAIPVT